jgi:hypothetical protein
MLREMPRVSPLLRVLMAWGIKLSVVKDAAIYPRISIAGDGWLMVI